MKKNLNGFCFPREGLAKILLRLKFLAFLTLFYSTVGATFSQAQQPQLKNITGIVKEASGQPIPGVSVFVEGTSVGTTTDDNGSFNLSVPAEAQTLVFSFVGMKSQKVALAGKSRFNIVLDEENIGVDEVVVVGYGTQKKANLTGAVDQVGGTAFENRSMTNLTQGLKGIIYNAFNKLTY